MQTTRLREDTQLAPSWLCAASGSWITVPLGLLVWPCPVFQGFFPSPGSSLPLNVKLVSVQCCYISTSVLKNLPWLPLLALP